MTTNAVISAVVVDAKTGQNARKWYSQAPIAFRTEPGKDMLANKTLQPYFVVRGSQFGDWITTEDGLYLPLNHPTTGAAILTEIVGEAPLGSMWYNSMDIEVEFRTEPDMEKRCGKRLGPGQAVAGTPEGNWFKTSEGLFLPLKHPSTGMALLIQFADFSGEQEVASWVGIQKLELRSEADMEKRCGKILEAGQPVRGAVEGEWLKTAMGLFLPMKHPTTGEPVLFQTWSSLGQELEFRTEPDMQKRSGKILKPGEFVKGLPEGQWLKTHDGLYLPMKHPVTGEDVITRTTPPTASAVASAPGQVTMNGNAPPGAPPGGHWEEVSYCGPVTICIFCCLFWPIVCCPVDKKQVYVTPDGRKLNADGSDASASF